MKESSDKTFWTYGAKNDEDMIFFQVFVPSVMSFVCFGTTVALLSWIFPHTLNIVRITAILSGFLFFAFITIYNTRRYNSTFALLMMCLSIIVVTGFMNFNCLLPVSEIDLWAHVPEKCPINGK